MSKIYVAAVVSVFLCIVGSLTVCAQTTSYRATEALDEQQVLKFRRQAQSGDAKAALRLYRHYAIGMGNVTEGLKFACQAAELGSCDGAEIAADIYLLSAHRNIKTAIRYRKLFDRGRCYRANSAASTREWADAAVERLTEEGIRADELKPLKLLTLKR